jgi:hypothetical protein
MTPDLDDEGSLGEDGGDELDGVDERVGSLTEAEHKDTITLSDGEIHKHLTEKRGATSEDIRLFKVLGKYLSGTEGERIRTFPSYIRETKIWREIIQRASYGNGEKAKTLLAIISKLYEVTRITHSEYTGSMAEGKDLSLEVIKNSVFPELVPALFQYAGWKWPDFDKRLIMEEDPERKAEGYKEHITRTIEERLGADSQTAYHIEGQEDDIVRQMQSDALVEQTLERIREKKARAEELNPDEIAFLAQHALDKMMSENK